MGVAGQTAAIALQQKGWKVSFFFYSPKYHEYYKRWTYTSDLRKFWVRSERVSRWVVAPSVLMLSGSATHGAKVQNYNPRP